MAAIKPMSELGGWPVEAASIGVLEGVDGFDRFVREQYPRLVQFLRTRSQTSQDAEDAAQESIIKLMRYRRSAPASDWPYLLHRIAINTAHDRFRAARRRQTMVKTTSLQAGLIASGRSPDEYAAREQVLTRVRRVIRKLPPKCRRVCVLKLARDMTNSEIARYCGVSTKMVEKHLAKGLAILCREVGDSTAGTFKES